MTFGNAVGSFWRNYFGFSGRATRAEYWWVVLFVAITAALLTFLDLILFEDLLFEVGVGPFVIVYMISLFFPYLALLVRRFHDVGMSGWLVLLAYIPYVGGLFAFVVSLIDSQSGTNRFGPSLKYPGTSPEQTTTGLPTRPQSGQASFGPVRDDG